MIRRKLFVVADESFALPGHELIRDIGISTHFISIYCPHKAISCNGYKFSGIVTSDIYEDFLEQWVDVLSGNLPQSCYASILKTVIVENILKHRIVERRVFIAT